MPFATKLTTWATVILIRRIHALPPIIFGSKEIRSSVILSSKAYLSALYHIPQRATVSGCHPPQFPIQIPA
jgi:hypothetical protein